MSEKEQGLSHSGLLAFLKKRKGVLDGVCISGGEPLIHDGLLELIGEIRELGYLVKLDTNGSFPEKLKRLYFIQKTERKDPEYEVYDPGL